MESWQLILLFGSSLLGGLGIFLFKKDNSNRLKLVLSFSGAYLFAITVLHLMPDVYSDWSVYSRGFFNSDLHGAIF